MDNVNEYYIPTSCLIQNFDLFTEAWLAEHTSSVSLRIFTRFAQLPCQKFSLWFKRPYVFDPDLHWERLYLEALAMSQWLEQS